MRVYLIFGFWVIAGAIIGGCIGLLLGGPVGAIAGGMFGCAALGSLGLYSATNTNRQNPSSEKNDKPTSQPSSGFQSSYKTINDSTYTNTKDPGFVVSQESVVVSQKSQPSTFGQKISNKLSSLLHWLKSEKEEVHPQSFLRPKNQ